MELNDDNFKILEEFTCLLYGLRDNSVDVVRHKILEKKYSKDDKVVELALLPPCRLVLLFHAQRANYVAKLWRSSLTSFVEMPPIFENGWNNDSTILWVDDVFPYDVTDILCEPNITLKMRTTASTRTLSVQMLGVKYPSKVILY